MISIILNFIVYVHVSMKLAGPERERQLSDTDVQSAVWEVCGDSGALQLLFDLLHVK